MKIKRFVFLLCISVALFQPSISFAQTEPSPSQTTQNASLALSIGDVLLYDSTFDNVWRVDPDTGERTLYYQNPPTTTFRDWYIDQSQQTLYAVEVPRNAVSPIVQGMFDLVKIDLLTGTQTLVWQHENLLGVTSYPPNSNYLLLTYYPSVENLVEEPRRVCLFSLIDHTCPELARDAAGSIATYIPAYWVNEQTFIAFFQYEPFLVYRMDLFDNNSQRLLEQWNIFSAISIPNSRNYLVVAQPNGKSIAAQNDIGFYVLNMDTLTLSEQIHPSPMLDSARLAFSPNGKYLLFRWGYDKKYSAQIIDYGNWSTVFEMQKAPIIQWLDDGNTLLGDMVNSDYSDTFVHVNPASGEINPLFTELQGYYFTVIH